MTESTCELLWTVVGVTHVVVVVTVLGAMIDWSDVAVYEPTSDYGVHFSVSGHWGPFKLTRMSANEATRYGTLDVWFSEDGDSAKTDAIVPKNGAYGDNRGMPVRGMSDEDLWSSLECMKEVSECGTWVA